VRVERAPVDTSLLKIQRDLSRILPVSRETIERLEVYRTLLEKWQRTTNLVGRDTLQSFWDRHVGDSLQCLNVIPDARRWLDLGSGGGFPGMVIAIAHAGDDGFINHLVDSNRRKCAFLRSVSIRCGANTVVHAERIENAVARFASENVAIEAITARAVAPLPQLLGLSAPVLRPGVTGCFHKGREYRRELEDCRGLWEFDLIVHESRIAADSVLLEIRNLSARRQ
jgi:16S rRNA (guanine527-N7)-methyltransferase